MASGNHGDDGLTENERELRAEVENLYNPHAPLKASNDDVIWTVEKYPMLNVTAINSSDSGGALRVNQEFKTAPKSYYEYMPNWVALTSVNWSRMIAELVISLSRFFPSDLVGAFPLQASIVKPARLTEVPAAVRALDDALYHSIIPTAFARHWQ